MKRIRIKFCGIKRRREIKKCIELGIDYIGFVFYRKSKRFININKAKKLSSIKNYFPFNIKVGVFVNPKKKLIKKVIKKVKINLIQVNEKWRKNIKKIKNIEIIRSYGINKKNTKKQIKKLRKKKEMFLLDKKSKKFGGIGRKFDWRIIKKINYKNAFISGGINIKNVKKLIKKYRMYAIDLSSGIEKNGKKSFKLMEKITKICNDKKL